MKNVMYFKSIGSIGGCESWFWYLSKLYDFVVYYREANPEQIERLSKNVEVHKYKDGEIIECDKFICCYAPDIINNVKAKEYIHVIHCDYKNVWFSPILNDKFTKYVAVSKVAGESFKEITGKDYELIYNPVAIDIPKVEKSKDKIHLISATRLTREKGLNRMIKLAQKLDKSGIDYDWTIYTNRQRQAISKNVIYKETKLDITKDIAKADYLVQLSDCEAFCYSVVEALMVGTKVIITDLPVFKELGINEDNAIICDMEMKNIDTINVLKNYKTFEYEPPKSNWGAYLDKKGKYDPNELVQVKVLRHYTDIILGHLDRGHEYKMTRARASYLEAKGLVEQI